MVAIKKIVRARMFAASVAGMAFFAMLLWSAPAAAARQCGTEYWNTASAWSVRPNADGLAVGTVLASATVSARTSSIDPPVMGGAFEVAAVRLTTQGYDSATDSVPVSGNPGVGLRVKWNGVTSLAPIADLNMHPIGTPIPTSMASVASGVLTMQTNPEYTASYLLELVVTDSDAYAGGGMTIVQTGTLMLLAKMEPNPGSTEPAYCGGVPNPTLPPASLQAVTLPVPPTPTCEFDTATLNQTVTLGAANSSSVARHGTARTAGVSGEKPFFIQAKNCGAGTIFHAYFTDALAASSTNDYLRPAGASNVGIRIYHDNDTTPVPLGPAPIGSTLPARAPITTGSVNAAQGANYSLPFTAQYVQLPDAGGSASPGEMSASAKLTIVYP